jgi:hypothetical protein
VHAVLTIAWFLLAIPTVLIWKDSVLFVGIASCYANAVGALLRLAGQPSGGVMRHIDDDPTACPCRPTRVGPSGRDEWIHHDPPPGISAGISGRRIFRTLVRFLNRRRRNITRAP